MILSGRPGVAISVGDAAAAATDERGRSDVDDDDIVVLRVVAPTPRTRVLIAAFILSRIGYQCCVVVVMLISFELVLRKY